MKRKKLSWTAKEIVQPICFTNADHRVSDRVSLWKITNSLLSNHRLLTLSITCDYKLKEETRETIFDVNVEILAGIVEQIDLSLQPSTENLSNSLVRAFPSSRVQKQNRTSKPWFDCELYALHKKKNTKIADSNIQTRKGNAIKTWKNHSKLCADERKPNMSENMKPI